LRPAFTISDDVAIDGLDAARDRRRIVRIDVGHIVERPVRLHVRHLRTEARGDAVERPDLVRNHVLEVLRAHLDLPSAETPEVVEARVRADRDAVRLRHLHGVRHHGRIAAVEAAGDARRVDYLHDRFVVADLEAAEALAHVGVDVDRGHALLLS
jgi:hypothetical protein